MRKIRIDRALSIVVVAIALSSLIMFGIKVVFGITYKKPELNTYVNKKIETLEAEKIYIATLLANNVDISKFSEEEKKNFEQKKASLVNAVKTITDLDQLQEVRKEYEIQLYTIEKLNLLPADSKLKIENGVYRIDGHVVVNKKYPLPEFYDPKENPEAKNAFLKLLLAMQSEKLLVNSSYIGYFDFIAQENIYRDLFNVKDEKEITMIEAKAGHSEHQTGLTYSVLNRTGKVLGSDIEDEKAIEWIEKNAAIYGFIIRFPKGKEAITGFNYRPYDLRYVGVETAKKMQELNQTFEEYFNVIGGIDYGK